MIFIQILTKHLPSGRCGDRPRYSQIGQTIINTCFQIVVKEMKEIREIIGLLTYL